MSRSDPYWSATNAAEVAERVVRDQSLTELPIDPMALARDQGITVLRKPARSPGVSIDEVVSRTESSIVIRTSGRPSS